MTFKLRVFHVALIAILAVSLASAEEIIAVADVTGWTNSTGTAPYDPVIIEFTEKSDLVKLVRYPTARAIQEVKLGNAVCFFGGDGFSFETYFGQPALSSRPIAKSSWRIITETSKPAITDFMQLKGLSIAVARGTPITGTTLGYDVSQLTMVELPNSATAIKMVLAGRVDAAMISINPDDAPIPGIHYDQSFAMATIQRGLNCDREHPLAAEIIQAFDEFLKER